MLHLIELPVRAASGDGFMISPLSQFKHLLFDSQFRNWKTRCITSLSLKFIYGIEDRLVNLIPMGNGRISTPNATMARIVSREYFQRVQVG